jgi:hypothetical protein
MATPVPDGKRFTHVYERGEPVGDTRGRRAGQV